MVSREYWKSYYQDDLVLRVITKNNKMFSQGKRLPNKSSELLKEIQRVYVKDDIVSAVKLIREKEFLSLGNSLKVFNVLRGKETYSWTHL